LEHQFSLTARRKHTIHPFRNLGTGMSQIVYPLAAFDQDFSPEDSTDVTDVSDAEKKAAWSTQEGNKGAGCG
jgi:hypothetical protein